MPDDTRIVSVLFVDLVASTALSVRLGDDATDRMRRRYFATLREAIALNRGNELSNAGDGMVAAFEGSAVDAVGCGVAMQRSVALLNERESGLDLAIRVGISIGEVAPDGDDWHGMPLIEAARLESAADPGGILVSDLVRSLVGSRGGYRFTSVGSLELKGLEGPLAASQVAWELPTGLPAVPVARALDTTDAPALVGRDEELDRIARVWRACLDGSTRGVTVHGPDAADLTRLAAAFAASLRGQDTVVLYGRSEADVSEPFQPFAEALRWYVAAANDEQVAEAVGPFGAGLAGMVPSLRRQLTDVAVDGTPGRAEIEAAVSSFLHHVAELAPVLLVLDGLGDADADTLHLLDHVLSAPSRARILILALGGAPDLVAEVASDIVELQPVRDEAPTAPASDAAPPSGLSIVGRAEPLRRIGEAAAASAAGRRTAIFVSGEAGIGKTTLVRGALDATAEDAVVGWGTCWHGEGAPAFWAWTQALDDVARLVGTDAAVAAAGQDRESLAVLVRDLGPAAVSHDDPERHRLLLLDAAVRWLEALATDRHLVVVLDDLQWADPSTLDLLDHLVNTPLAARILVMGMYRHDELDADRRGPIATLVSHGEHIHVEGMSVEEVEELVASIVGEEDAARLAPELHRRTGGHPLFVSELARLPELGAGGQVPTVVSEVVARRLRALPESTRTVLDAASVLGNRLLVDVLADVTGQRPPEVTETLEAAVDAGVVRSDLGAGSELWFAHDLFRETLYDQLRTSERIALHGQIGAALEGRHERGADVAPADVARHLILAVALGEPDPAVRWARSAAAEERRRSAFSEAAAHLHRVRSAVADAGLTLEPDVVVGLVMEEADDRARSGDPDQARELLTHAAAVAASPDLRADVALAVHRLGSKSWSRRDETIAGLEAALEGVAGNDPIREARVTAALARELQHSVAEDRLRAGPFSERALELGRAADDDATLTDCLLARHDALWIPGTGAERAEIGHEIALIAGRLGDTDRLAEGLMLEANGLLESGSPGFRPVLDRWFSVMEERDEPHDRYMVLTRRAALALIDGRTEDAESLMHDAAVVGERVREPDTGNVLMSQRVTLSQTADDADELRTLAEDAVVHWTSVPVLAHVVAAGAYAAAGDLDDAAREVMIVADSGGWQSETSYVRSVLVGHLAEAAAILGDTELCRELFDEIEPLAGSCGMHGAVVAFAGPFAHPAGILAAALGEHERAAALLTQSVTIAGQIGAHRWARRSEDARKVLESTVPDRPEPVTVASGVEAPDRDVADLRRTGRIWTITHAGETGSVNHVKGIGDIVELVRRPRTEIAALELAGGKAADTSREQVVDDQALDAYRRRLLDIEEDLDEADRHGDAGQAERMVDEREQLLDELRRSTALGGRSRTDAGAPAEKARKAVSARIRDAIGRLDAVVPTLAAHLNRSIRTGTRCAYEPGADESPIRWQIED